MDNSLHRQSGGSCGEPCCRSTRRGVTMFVSMLESIHELIFPSFCLQCNCRLPCREQPLLCESCFSDVAFICSPKCTCCGTPFLTGTDHRCSSCLREAYTFDLARAVLHYREPIISLISDLKFNGVLDGLGTLGCLAVNSPALRDLSDPDLIMPVPLHAGRLRQRKFNQALLIARKCFPELKEKINPALLVRHRATSPQTGLTGVKRRKNLTGAFSISDPAQVRDKSILLVDDVFTTGSTVNECAKVLRKAGSKRIEVFTVARAV